MITSKDASYELHESAFLPLAQNFVQELLLEIYSYRYYPKNKTPRLCRDQCPLKVSHVCRAWRNTALSTRKLWAGVHILCKGDDYVLDASMAMQQWIARSGTSKVDLRIECLDVRPKKERKKFGLGHERVLPGFPSKHYFAGHRSFLNA